MDTTPRVLAEDLDKAKGCSSLSHVSFCTFCLFLLARLLKFYESKDIKLQEVSHIAIDEAAGPDGSKGLAATEQSLGTQFISHPLCWRLVMSRQGCRRAARDKVYCTGATSQNFFQASRPLMYSFDIF